jgi:transposase
VSSNPPIDFKVENLADLPLLMEHLKRMGIAELVDQTIPTHGNWQGLSLGWTITVWLAHILSQADHCLVHVQEWVKIHQETLQELTGIESLRELDFTDDRLQGVLRYLNKDEEWSKYEQAQGKHLIRVYGLSKEVVRLDTTTASTFQAANPEGILRLGVSKDHRPDLAQLKVMLATLDPLGLPLATQVVSGNSADDPLYIPAIEQVRAILNQKGVLFVGDSKMSALETRRTIDAGDDYYLTPLPAKIITPKILDGYLDTLYRDEEPVQVKPIYKDKNGETALIAQGFEIKKEIRVETSNGSHHWDERHLVVRSEAHAQAQEASLEERLVKAEEEIRDLIERRRGKKRIATLTEMKQAIQEILDRYKVVGLLDVTCHEQVTERTLRSYGGKPGRTEREVTFTVEVLRHEEALKAARRRFGWRVYATNAPEESFFLEKLVLVYRDQYIIEHDNSRLKGQPLSLTPFYLQREDHITGLTRLLSIALGALTLFDFLLRQALAAPEEEPLREIYPGNPKRSTCRPSAELVLRAFRNINRVALPGAPPRLTPLTSTQTRVLKLLGFSESIYIRADAIRQT